MFSSYLMSMLLVGWVFSSSCSLSALQYLGALGQGNHFIRVKLMIHKTFQNSDDFDWLCMTWLATIQATSLLAVGLSSHQQSVQECSSSRFGSLSYIISKIALKLFSFSPGRISYTKATTTPGGLMLSDTSWPAPPWAASLATPSGCGSLLLELGERLGYSFLVSRSLSGYILKRLFFFFFRKWTPL